MPRKISHPTKYQYSIFYYPLPRNKVFTTIIPVGVVITHSL